MKYMSVKEAAKKWNVTSRHVQQLCSDDKIEGAIRFGEGRVWMIPNDAQLPTRKRKSSASEKDRSIQEE